MVESGDHINKFLGCWKLESSDKFDEYMKAVGVGFVMRKMGAVAKPNVTISLDGEQWSIKSETSFTTHENKFKLGEEFEETTPDGRKTQTTVEFVDNKLVQNQKGTSSVVASIITRELTDDDTMICICTANDVTCKRVYQRIK